MHSLLTAGNGEPFIRLDAVYLQSHRNDAYEVLSWLRRLTYRLYGNTHAIGAQLTSDKLHGERVHVEGVYESATNWLRVREVYLVGEKPNPFGFDGENR